ncbi:MAG: TonB C-terminal domain-containing protein [Nitrospirae bacterium]|nr:TonB C-terminal domain-containing protein [Nitrospirota bacterium]
MKHRLHIGKEPSFQTIIIASAALHLIFLALIVVPLKTKEKEYQGYFVDLVAPLESPSAKSPHAAAKGGKEAAGITAPSKDTAKPSSKADMSLESVGEQQKVAKEIERLRAISMLSKMKKKKEEEKIQEIEIIRQKIHGSAAKEPSVQGGGRSVNLDSYYAVIYRKIKDEWIYPAELDSSGLEAIISFRIDDEGKVISHKIEKSSGNRLFDRSAVNAILKASPLPPNPVEEEIEVRFRL